jgi:hypothetical protein
MLSRSTTSKDSEIVSLWLERQASPLTRSCYQRDISRLLAHTAQPLAQIGLGTYRALRPVADRTGAGSHFSRPHAGRREESFRLLPTHAVPAGESRH